MTIVMVRWSWMQAHGIEGLVQNLRCNIRNRAHLVFQVQLLQGTVLLQAANKLLDTLQRRASPRNQDGIV